MSDETTVHAHRAAGGQRMNDEKPTTEKPRQLPILKSNMTVPLRTRVDFLGHPLPPGEWVETTTIGDMRAGRRVYRNVEPGNDPTLVTRHHDDRSKRGEQP